MSYKNIIQEAWRITKAHHFLLFFGLFAAILTGIGGDFEILTKSTAVGFNQTTFPFSFEALAQGGSIDKIEASTRAFLGHYGNNGIVIMAIGILCGLVAFWFASLCQGAIIATVLNFEKQKSTRFTQAIGASSKHAATLMSMNALRLFITWFIGIILTLPLLLQNTEITPNKQTLGIVALGFFVLIPLSIIVKFITRYAAVHAVAHNSNVLQALEAGWRVLKKHWLSTLELSLLFFVIYTLGSIAVALLIVIATLPLFGLISFSFVQESSAIFWIGILLINLLQILIILFFGAVMSAFETSAWTLLAQELKNRQEPSSGLHEFTSPFFKSLHTPGKRKKTISI